MLVFKLKDSYNVSEQQRSDILMLLEIYSKTYQGSWLNELNWKNLIYKWCEHMLYTDGVMGAYSVWYPNTIFLLPYTDQKSWKQQIQLDLRIQK